MFQVKVHGILENPFFFFFFLPWYRNRQRESFYFTGIDRLLNFLYCDTPTENHR